MNIEPISTCEREFTKLSVQKDKRIDGRSINESRPLHLAFGRDWGSCIASLGETRVFAQVSCEISSPKVSRPSEGQLFVNFELSPMAAAHFEAGRLGDFGVEISRLLERCIRDSNCLDLESLCILSEEKAWNIRVDVHVLNYCGNITECASIAIISALLHFKRPDVTVIGTEVTVHPVDERDPVPLHLHHIPLCLTYAFFDGGKVVLVDPVELEERVADGVLTVGVNAHYEICTIHQKGCVIVKDQVLLCARLAAVRVKSIAEFIKGEIKKDSELRSSRKPVGFAATLNTSSKIFATEAGPKVVGFEDVEEAPVQEVFDFEEFIKKPEEEAEPATATEQQQKLHNRTFVKQSEPSRELKNRVKTFLEGVGTAVGIGMGGKSKWEALVDKVDEESPKRKKKKPKNVKRKPKAETFFEEENSEEEEVQVLETEFLKEEKDADSNENEESSDEDLDLTKAVKKQAGGRGWYRKAPLL